MTDEAGWNYTNNPTKEGGDSRKLCTIDVDGMTFVGIRIWVSGRGRWESNGEPCPHENVRAWQDLPEPARGRWYRGKLAFPSKGPAIGMYNKFVVYRTVGASERGRKHDGCEYFVLDLDHDPHAKAAIIAYAESCRAEYPTLAVDLMNQTATHRFGGPSTLETEVTRLDRFECAYCQRKYATAEVRNDHQEHCDPRNALNRRPE